MWSAGAVLVCVCFFAAVSAFRHAERVDVTVLRESSESRAKRATDDVSNMPSTLAIRVSSSETPAVLRLRRHALLHPRLIGQAESSQQTVSLVDSAVYSDQSRSATLMVRRSADGEYTLHGNFVHENEEYMISPMKRTRRATPRSRRRNHHVFSTSASNGALSFVGDAVVDEHRGEGRRHSQGQKSQEHQGGRHGQQSGEQDPQNGGRGQQSGGQDSQNGGRGQQSGEQDPQEGGRGHQSGGRGHGRRGRGKRQAQITHFLETALIVDFSEYSVWVDEYGANAVNELTLYYSYLAQSIATRYSNVQTVQPSFSIDFSVIDFVVLTDSTEASYMENLADSTGAVNGSRALDSFFTWLQGRQDIAVADHYMTFTGFDLYATDGNGQPVDVAGIAYTGTVCTDSALSVTENARNGLTAAVAAHELGHSLSAEHDVNAGCDDNDQYIMTTSLRVPVSSADKSNPWLFSPCSIASFQSYLDGQTCTSAAETKGTNELPSSGQLAGQALSRDEQCAFYFLNSTSQFCEGTQASASVGGLNTLCYGMLCSDPENTGSCRYILPQEYTPCGDGKWCEQGLCVDIVTTTAAATTATAPPTTSSAPKTTTPTQPPTTTDATDPPRPTTTDATEPPRPTTTAATDPPRPTTTAATDPPRPTTTDATDPPRPTTTDATDPPRPTTTDATDPPRPTTTAATRPPRPTTTDETGPPRPTTGATRPPRPTTDETRPPRPTTGATRPPRPTTTDETRPPRPTTAATRPPRPTTDETRPPRPNTGATRPPRPNTGATRPPRPTTDETRPPRPTTGATRPPRPTTGATRPPRPTTGATRPPRPTTDETRPPRPTTGATRPPRPTTGATRPPRPTTGATRPPRPNTGATRPPRPITDETRPPRPNTGATRPPRPTPAATRPPRPTTAATRPPRPTPPATMPPRPTAPKIVCRGWFWRKKCEVEVSPETTEEEDPKDREDERPKEDPKDREDERPKEDPKDREDERPKEDPKDREDERPKEDPKDRENQKGGDKSRENTDQTSDRGNNPGQPNAPRLPTTTAKPRPRPIPSLWWWLQAWSNRSRRGR